MDKKAAFRPRALCLLFVLSGMEIARANSDSGKIGLMEILTSKLKWLFFESSFGMVGVAAGVYVILNTLKKAIPKFPDPFVIAALIFFVGQFTVPNIPHYQFEDHVLSQIQGTSWIRVVNKVRRGFNLMTWIISPIDSVTMIMPNDPLEVDSYRVVVVRYQHEPRVAIVDARCDDFTIWVAQQSEAPGHLTSGRERILVTGERSPHLKGFFI